MKIIRPTLRQRIAIRLRLFKDDVVGMAAVEFGYLVPIIVLMTFGTFEASRALMMHKRFQRATAMVGDLVAREETIGDSASSAEDQMNGIMKAAEHTLSPFDPATLKIGVSAIQADSKNPSKTSVAWSYKYHNYPIKACGESKNMPTSGMITAGNAAILVESEYRYEPLLSTLVPGFDMAITWKNEVSNAPRGRCPNYAGKNCTC